MAVVSDSGDASDIFWPGYVDAVTNLAINLLFVIAVMSIVVLGAVLQMADMTKKKNQQENLSHAAAVTTINSEHAVFNSSPTEKNTETIQQNLTKTQSQLKLTTLQLEEALRKLALLEGAKAAEVVVKDNTITESKQTIKMKSLGASTLMVSFSQDVVTLSKNELQELSGKLRTTGSLKEGSWQITVVSPKGFSEAVRLSFYRAHAVRNALLENGVQAGQINLHILESGQVGADNSKVLVKWQP